MIADLSPSSSNSRPSSDTSAQTLSDRVAGGFAWTIVQTIGVKVVGFGAQLILARLLLHEDFGRVALAYTITSFAVLLQQAGLRESLIRRQKHFDRWANAAFWMSLSLGLLSAMAMAIAAPIAAKVYGDPTIAGLILIVALAAPLNAISVIPAAKMQAALRFREVAVITVLESVAISGISILLASPWIHAGAWSFVIPMPIVAGARCMTLWILSRPRLRRTLHLRRWRHLYAEGSLIFGAYICFAIVMQGDYVILKLVVHSTEVVGTYYFAFLLSMQTVSVLTISLMNVLLPVLSQLTQEPQRQIQAFIRATRLLAIVSLPPCLLQAILAEPLIRLLFGAGWLPAAPVLQILSIGMAVRIIAGPIHSLFTARGALREYVVWALIYVFVFIVFVSIGTLIRGAVGTAIGVGASIWLCEIYALILVIRPGGQGLRTVVGIFAFPIFASAAAVAIGAWAGRTVAPNQLHDVCVILLTTVFTLSIYLPLTRWFAATEWREATERIGKIISRLKRIPIPTV